MKLIVTAIFAILLSGCVTVPSPETVMQYCEREVSAIETRGHSTDRQHLNRVYAQCVDNRYAYEAATRTVQSTRRYETTEGRFSAREGETGTYLRASETRGRHVLERDSHIRLEDRWGAWVISSGFKISH